jgi:hypothetical protein
VASKQATKKAKAVDSSKAADTDDTTTSLDLVKKAFEASWTYTQGSWHDRWQNNYKLYNNERVNRGYNGITDTFVPMKFSTVETLTSGLFGTKPKFGYMPPSNKQDQDCDILNGLLDYYWDKDIWSMKVINTGRSMVMLGVGVDYFCWDVDHPVMINVPLRDFFIDPNASSLETACYMGRRYLTTVDELKTYEVIDPATGKMAPKYQNLDKLKEVTTDSTTTKSNGQQSQETTDKQEKDMFYGSSTGQLTRLLRLPTAKSLLKTPRTTTKLRRRLIRLSIPKVFYRLPAPVTM